MKRVSSRQRLVSWDAFDASLDADLSDSEYSDNDSPVLLLQHGMAAKMHATGTTVGSWDEGNMTVGRKRGRKQLPGPVVIPSFDWEIEDTSKQDDLSCLADDVKLHVFSFLDLDSLRSVMGTNHVLRSLVSGARMSVWKLHMEKQWPMLSSADVNLVDSHSLPTATSSSPVNLPLLLSLTPPQLPTKVDESLLEHPGRRNRHSIVRSRNRRILARPPTAPPKLQVTHSEEHHITHIHYVGPIGAGDRCVRANHPLPRPMRKAAGHNQWGMIPPKFLLNAHPLPAEGVHSARQGSLLDLLCQGARAVSRRGMADWKPFVAPSVQSNGSMDVTPRMVAYYEVDISERKPKEAADDEEEPTPLPNSASECVAVGIATESFHIHSRMPGWDSLSFGYHGDDGGTFHASGGMQEHFGPKFGAGDTVGCGIDYVAQGIFFTLNGEFLGYGWKNIPVEFLHNDLYPVVGIDTNLPISLNFGTHRPFKYDLSEFDEKHSQLIEPQFCFRDRRPSRQNSSGSHSSASSSPSRFSLKGSCKR